MAVRERLVHLLTEAAEIERNLLCSYLYAAFSLKRGATAPSGRPQPGDAQARGALERQWITEPGRHDCSTSATPSMRSR